MYTGDETKVVSATPNAVSVLVTYELPGRMSYPNTKRYATLKRTVTLRSQLRFLINTKGSGQMLLFATEYRIISSSVFVGFTLWSQTR